LKIKAYFAKNFVKSQLIKDGLARKAIKAYIYMYDKGGEDCLSVKTFDLKLSYLDSLQEAVAREAEKQKMIRMRWEED